MTGISGDAITLLEVVNLYEITMVVEEMTEPMQKDEDIYGGVGHFYKRSGWWENQITFKFQFWQSRCPWVKNLSRMTPTRRAIALVI